MRPFGNHQLRGVTDQGVGKGSVDAALIVEICPRQVSLHQKRRHLVDPIGRLEHRRQPLNARWQRGVETGDRRDTRDRQFVHPVDSHMASPDHPRVDGPGIFQRSVLRHRHTALDSVVIEAVAQGQRSRIVVPASAVAAADAVPVVDLVVYLDVELVVWAVRQCRVVVVIEFVPVAGLRIEVEDGQSNGIQFAGRDHIRLAVVLHLRPVYAWIPTPLRSRVVDDQRQVSTGNHVCREIALPLRQGRYGHNSAGRAGTSNLLEIHEKECTVLDDRST